MKITAQFNRSPEEWIAVMVLYWHPFAVLLGAIVLWFIADSVVLSQSAKPLRERQAELASRLAALPNADLAKISELQQMRAQAQLFNSLEESRQRPITMILASIERALPSGGTLTRLEYGRNPNVVVLQGVAPRAEWVASFVENLERQGSYEQVVLAHQIQDNRSPTAVRYEIRLKADSGNAL